MRVLHIAKHLSDLILAAARDAFPNECCGLIEGVAQDEGWRALALHPARNLASNPEAEFLVDPQTQFDLLHRLRGTERRIIGCFHSHPNGDAAPSDTDRAGALEPDFVWVIAAGNPQCGFALNAFLVGPVNEFLPLALRD